MRIFGVETQLWCRDGTRSRRGCVILIVVLFVVVVFGLVGDDLVLFFSEGLPLFEGHGAANFAFIFVGAREIFVD